LVWFWRTILSLASPVEVQPRGILFDLDGVLVDSTPAVARCWSRWAEQYGFNADEIVHRAHGRPSIVTLRELMPDGDYEEENRKMEEWEIADTDGVVPLPGVMEILRALPADQWTIVTSCTRPLAEVRIRVAGLPRPKKLVTSGDVQRFKPDPDPYLKGAELLGFAPADCVVVEDAPAGIRAGRAAGSRVLALRTTEVDELLKAAGATWIVDDLSRVTLGPPGAGRNLTLSLRT
jgi:sugar-phosphatase